MASPRVKGLLIAISKRQDLVLVMLLVLAIMMMILPLPTVLVDTLIATNIAITIMLLMVAIYLKDPLEFSTLPAVILLTTIFRLALSITTTRLILIQADAGQIIETFGTFVVGGNVVVGLVVFLIITVVQFVVITKGAERVAEVSARFSLDALPGKQMSIDSDLRSGTIDMVEARRRRQHLEKESQLYGSMDGAMKFVKGDAIAGLVIIAVNLLGGMAIGSLQNGMSLAEAMQVYSLLTVGDGLVSQIPALFVSIAAGSIVTRVTSEDSDNLGTDIATQFIARPRTLRVASFVLLGFAFIPGFPTTVFLALAAILGGGGLLYYLRDRKLIHLRQERTAHLLAGPDSAEPGETTGALAGAPIVVHIGPQLRQTIVPSRFSYNVGRVRDSMLRDLGVPFPHVSLELDEDLAGHAWRISVENVPVAEGELDPQLLWIRDDATNVELAGVPSARSKTHVPGDEVVVVGVEHRKALEEAGIGFIDPLDTLTWLLGRALSRYASEFIGIQETRQLLASMEGSHMELVREAQRVVPLQRIAEILRRLVAEGVPIRNLRLLLEAIVEWGQKEKDVVLLAEYVRSALKRQISHRYANRQKIVPAFMLEPAAEEAIRNAVRHTSVGSYLALEPELGEKIIGRLKTEIGNLAQHGTTPIVLSSLDVRRFVRSLLMSYEVDLPVLSYQDLAQEVTVHPLGTIAI